MNPPEKWLRFENTHVPLIDRETWEIVRKVRSGKRRPNKMGEMDLLSGSIDAEKMPMLNADHFLKVVQR